MFNNRMLAVAAVLIMAVPVLGAAAPVVIPTATPEQLVEGHTVFTVIEAQDAKTFNGTTRFAAAVAVLVREYASENRNVRFPGVLWFNDQYLVSPESGENNAIDYRYPCGGAVMAVNRGDPDPRVNLASVGVTDASGTTWTQTGQAPHDNLNATVDTTTTPPGATYQSDAALGMYAAQFGNSYKETYTIIDPNDHTWVIDRYEAYYRTTPSAQSTAMFTSNVWVVNILGTAAFVPDDGTLNCQAFRDQVSDALPPEVGAELACGGRLTRSFPTMLADDEPCAGYAEPSRNGYCYSGPAMANCTQAPVRLYNAVLYFKLEHLGVEGAPRTHTTASTDTNGCEVGTEWACPAAGDNAEGNSHPFHPTTTHPTTGDEETCLATSPAPQPNPTNHGGSASATPGSADSTGRYGPLPCDYTHATRDIDIYFSPSGRPLRPVFTNSGGVSDTEGSSAPFQNYPTAYSTTH